MRSLNLRTATGSAVVLTIFVALTGLALERAFQDSAREAQHQRMLALAYLLMAEAEIPASGAPAMPNTPPEPRLALPDSGLVAQISRADTRWRSASALDGDYPFLDQLKAGEQRFEAIEQHGKHWFVLGYGVDWVAGTQKLPVTFSLAEDRAQLDAQIARYRQTLWGWLGAMAALLVFSQLVVLRWGLKPLRGVARELSDIEQGSRDRLSEEQPRELQGLTRNLNGLLYHERAQQRRYRDALADLAHSLKTPLAILRGAHAQSGGAKACEPELQTLRENLDEQITRMDEIVARQLQRAATRGYVAMAKPVKLRAIIERIAGALAKVYYEKAPQLDIDCEAQLAWQLDEGDATELLGNLLDNAAKWCNGHIAVSVKLAKGDLLLEVSDDGPGFRPRQAEKLLERGARADESVPGHGIGLAMVRDIVDAYEGELELTQSKLGGAAVQLRLPR